MSDTDTDTSTTDAAGITGDDTTPSGTPDTDLTERSDAPEEPEEAPIAADEILAALDELPKGSALEVLERESRLTIRSGGGHPQWQHAPSLSAIVTELVQNKRALANARALEDAERF